MEMMITREEWSNRAQRNPVVSCRNADYVWGRVWSRYPQALSACIDNVSALRCRVLVHLPGRWELTTVRI